MKATTVFPQMASGAPSGVQPWHRVPNDHRIRVDENFADHESQNSLPFADRGVRGAVAQVREEALKVLGQLEVDFLAGQSAVEGFDLGGEVPLLLPQIGHASAKLIQGNQVRFVGHQEALDGRSHPAQFDLQVRAPGRRRGVLPMFLETSSQLATDEPRVGHQACDLLPHEIIEMILANGTVGANRPARPLAWRVDTRTSIVDVRAAATVLLPGATVRKAAPPTDDQSLQE